MKSERICDQVLVASETYIVNTLLLLRCVIWILRGGLSAVNAHLSVCPFPCSPFPCSLPFLASLFLASPLPCSPNHCAKRQAVAACEDGGPERSGSTSANTPSLKERLQGMDLMKQAQPLDWTKVTVLICYSK